MPVIHLYTFFLLICLLSVVSTDSVTEPLEEKFVLPHKIDKSGAALGEGGIGV
jgi:hypothetical protein